MASVKGKRAGEADDDASIKVVPSQVLSPPPPFISLPSSSSSSPCTPDGSAQGSSGAGAATPGCRPRRVLVFLVPGNPGLIGYYGPFLSHLRQLLDESEARQSPPGRFVFDLHGTSLAGFDHPPEHRQPPFRVPHNPPNNVEDQIQFVRRRVEEVARERRADDVVLMGHSVGAYISCELFHREETKRSTSSGEHRGCLPLRGAMLLFPTLSHIALSPSGRRMALLQSVALLDSHAHVVATLFLALWPAWLLRWLLRAVLRHSPHSVDTTSRWLGSRDGVWQAIHMGKDEMRIIAEDRWGEEFWDGQTPQLLPPDETIRNAVEDEESNAKAGKAKDGEEPVEAPRFFLLYGKEDHWVPSPVRDEFIAARARREAPLGKQQRDGPEDVGTGRTRIVVDQSGVLPHAFCIHHSEAVAEKVRGWIGELVEHL